MKLGELRGERAVEVIAELIAPIANIAMDQESLQLFKADKKEGETDRDAAIRDFTEKIPNLLKTHKKDVLAILCSVNNSEPDDLSLLDIIKGTVELVNDPDFMSLFLSAVSEGDKTPPSESSVTRDHSKPES